LIVGRRKGELKNLGVRAEKRKGAKAASNAILPVAPLGQEEFEEGGG